MTQYTDASNINYGNVSKGNGFSKISHSNTDFEDEIVGKVVNAVEIDWNGAQLGDKEINTTGELLSYISGVANNIPEVPADVITESKLSAMGYVTSSKLSEMGYVTSSKLSEMGYITSVNLNESSQNVQDWVTTYFVEKPTVTKILAGVITLGQKIDLSSNSNLKSLIKDKIALNLHKDSWDYKKPFNVGYVSTNNIDVDGNLYGTIKCTTNTAGYLYLVTVQPISSEVMGDELPSATYLSTFTYISSNTLPTAINKFNSYTDVEFSAYLTDDNTVGNVWVNDSSAYYDIHAGLTIVDYDVYISQGTLLNIYTKFICGPTSTEAPSTTPSGTPAGTSAPSPTSSLPD